MSFKIKSQFRRELREDQFSQNRDDDAYDHINHVLGIVSMFNIPGVSHDAVMLRVFPYTLSGTAKRWVDRLAPDTINTWDLLKKAFLDRYCPPSKTAIQLEEIHNLSKMATNHYTKLGNGIMIFSTSVQPTISMTTRLSTYSTRG